MQGRFNPLSARFALDAAQEAAANQGSDFAGSNFAGFLNRRGTMPVSGQGFVDTFRDLAGIFGPGADEGQQAIAGEFGDATNQATVANIISSGFASQFAPFLRRGAGRVAARNIAQFEGGNEGNIPLFEAFLRGLLGSQGGGPSQFFGGFQ